MSSEATAQALRRRDADARDRAQRCFDRPLVIEAGAGTGKTAALVARIVAWAMGPGWERALARAEDAQRSDRIAADLLSRVAAITFTDAACAEMAERVGEALLAGDVEETIAQSGRQLDLGVELFQQLYIPMFAEMRDHPDGVALLERYWAQQSAKLAKLKETADPILFDPPATVEGFL